MPANRNPRVTELLSWHGHTRGGVHVPFQPGANPLGQTIVTGVIAKLRALAKQLAGLPDGSARWVFLIGGPGNGKSEAVQDFLVNLDSSLGLNGALCQLLRTKFTPNPILPRKVEIVAAEFPPGNARDKFAAHIGRLMVVQDATATQTANGNAARELADDVADLLTSAEAPPPVFVACANRGLLARAMNEANRAFGNQELTRIFSQLIRASSIGREALAGAGRPSCWPLAEYSKFACWPLDVETLLEAPGPAPAAFDQMVTQATDATHWEVGGRCGDCDARDLCPFRQNAAWLRDPSTRANLAIFLRRGELARGQRWNFRDALSLTAELVVGQWSDAAGESHPCTWVTRNVQQAMVSPASAPAVVSLVRQLYPHAIFRGHHLEALVETLQRKAKLDTGNHPMSAALVQAIQQRPDASTKPIREVLHRDYARLDPALSTPLTPTHPLRVIEDAFSQSIGLGSATLPPPPLTGSETLLLEMLEDAEQEWDLLARDSTESSAAVCVLRRIAAIVTKRSIGIRRGHHALEDMLIEYAGSLRDITKLAAIKDALQQLLGKSGFQFSLVQSFGQPQNEGASLVSLTSNRPGVRAYPAPTGTPTTPGHDVPSFEVTDTHYPMPITFDFFMALRLRAQGCAGSSLPASVRASLDRVRHKYAGKLCRAKESFVDGRATIHLGPSLALTLQDTQAAPSLAPL